MKQYYPKVNITKIIEKKEENQYLEDNQFIIKKKKQQLIQEYTHKHKKLHINSLYICDCTNL
ncbi:46462_t:CDS:2 [Gigaspora margarita]|uniref:46462_t:CDS:1 n=1 Tax=Gigaspora margarita TaxID=4874 RepID=A0ABN7URW4_GIGMA|nr:46462_t:CDS:2 [Gigaspora margarita]